MDNPNTFTLEGARNCPGGPSHVVPPDWTGPYRREAYAPAAVLLNANIIAERRLTRPDTGTPEYEVAQLSRVVLS